MAGAGIYSFSEEEEWDDIFNNNQSLNIRTHGKAEMDAMDLDTAQWLISDYNDHIVEATQDYLMDYTLQNNNVGREEEDRDHHTDTASLEIDDDIFICMEMDCLGDPLLPELSDSITCTDSSNRSIGTTVLESSSNGSLNEGFLLSEIEYKGLRLVHLLTACAEAISQEAHDLAKVILLKLRGLVSPTGFTMERVAYYLYHALQSKISPLGPMELKYSCKLEHFLGAFRLLHQVYPYMRIAHFTANQCILEALTSASSLTGCCCLHIIDFDIMEGMQWPPLMEALKSGGYAVGHMKITAIKHWDDDQHNSSLLCQQTGRRLAECAESLGFPFSFEEMELQNLKEIRTSKHTEEIVAANCMWGLPHMTERGKLRVREFLQAVGHMSPEILTLATGPHGVESETDDFLDRFSACLKYLCAVFDSLEAGLPEYGLASAAVERIFFGPTMCRNFMSTPLEQEEVVELFSKGVLDIPLKCGFGEGVMSIDNVMQAKYLLSWSCGEVGRYYEVDRLGDHQLLLKWGSTPLVWVSTWDSPQ